MKKEKTLFERYGGQETLEKVMNRFFNYVINDKQIGGYYVKNVNDFGMHYRSFVNAIGQITGGPSYGQKQKISGKHATMTIKQQQFDLVWQYLSISFYQEGVSEYDIQQIRKAIYTVAGDIITKKQSNKEQIKKRQKIQEKKKKFQEFKIKNSQERETQKRS